MNYIIVISGPDNIGKTTLAKTISELKFKNCSIQKLELPTIEAYYEIPDFHRKKAEYFFEVITNLNDNRDSQCLLLDRSMWDELVYGKYYRHYDVSYIKGFEQKCKSFKNVKFLFIVLYGDETTVKRFSLKAKSNEKYNYQKLSSLRRVSTLFIDNIANVPFGKKLFVNENNIRDTAKTVFPKSMKASGPIFFE